jgi:oxygen-dependent protoporphyrinogen oxidase
MAPRVLVVGGGISGMATAHLLRERGLEVVVFEAERPGGKIESERRDGFLCEHGPAGFLDNAPDTLALASSLGLSPLRADERAKRRFLWIHDRLERIPEGPGSFLRSRILTARAKLRILGEPWARQAPAGVDETVLAFATRRLGAEVAERLVAPMVAGIYAGDAARLSIASALPRLARLEREHGSLIGALRKLKAAGPGPSGTLTSFAGGMAELTTALSRSLGDALRRRPVRALEQSGGRLLVRLDGGATETGDALILAVPADAAAALLADTVPAAAAALSAIPYAAVDVVCLGYAQEDVPHDLSGFGFLVAPGEGLRVLGCLWETSIFPARAERGQVLFRLMLGGARDPAVAELPAAGVLAVARHALASSLGVRAEPRMERLVRWARAIPQYVVGHAGRVAAAEQAEVAIPGLFLTGNALHGVGINDCVREAVRIAERVTCHVGGSTQRAAGHKRAV